MDKNNDFENAVEVTSVTTEHPKSKNGIRKRHESKLHKTLRIIKNIICWGVLAMLDNAVSEKFMTNACNRLYTIADTEEEVFNQLENYVPFTYNKYEFLKKDGEQNG